MTAGEKEIATDDEGYIDRIRKFGGKKFSVFLIILSNIADGIPSHPNTKPETSEQFIPTKNTEEK